MDGQSLSGLYLSSMSFCSFSFCLARIPLCSEDSNTKDKHEDGLKEVDVSFKCLLARNSSESIHVKSCNSEVFVASSHLKPTVGSKTSLGRSSSRALFTVLRVDGAWFLFLLLSFSRVVVGRRSDRADSETVLCFFVTQSCLAFIDRQAYAIL